MNHRILLCLVLILGNFLATSADCLDSKPGDVDYDCTNDVEETRHEEASEEKIDDVVDQAPDYSDNNEHDYHDNPPENPESSTSTSVNTKSTTEDEMEYDYDSEEHEDPETQQDETYHDHNEYTEHKSLLNDIDVDSRETITETPSAPSDDQHINLFYDAIKATLTSGNYTNAYRYVKHPERVECMITEMRKSKVMDKMSKESYIFRKNDEQEVKFEFRNVTTFMYDLEREIQDANFDCTQMRNSRIYIFIFVALLAIVFLVLYIRRR